MKHTATLAKIALIAAALSGCSRGSAPDTPAPRAAAPESPYLTIAPGEDGFIAVPLSRISDKALYVNVPKEGAPLIQLLAIRDGGGNARIAFNTCQACSPSPRAWFAQRDDGRLVCQNCGNDFGPEAVGSRSGGCNPAFIPGVQEAESVLRIPAVSLDAARPAFANWTGPRE